MKILTIHADFIEFEAKKKAFKGAEEGIKEGKHRVEECLVVFSAVQKADEDNLSGVVDRYVHEIKDVAAQVKVKNIVLYPYAHLSSDLAAPVKAEQALKDAEKKLLAEKFKVERAPFGWYKSFTIACKGHPLSELSREFGAEGASSSHQLSSTASLKREYKDELFTISPNELSVKEKIKLSAAFLVGKAIKDIFPHSELGSLGLHQDEAYIDVTAKLKNEHLLLIEKQVKKILQKPLPFKSIPIQDIKETLQLDILHDLKKQSLSYKLDNVSIVPPFKEPFVNSTKEIAALKLLHLGSAYWKNNSNNVQLTRVYVVAFGSEKELEEYLHKKEEAENRSHLKIGKEQQLFVVSELVGQGLPLLTPKGTIIRNEITKFLWELHKDKGYQQVWTPHIAKDLLYKTSGHWDKFGDELFKVKGKSDDFIMKPMNCPHHMQIFDSFAFSYRDLPVRYFEPATVYRDEKSGQLLGLSRVRAITQDDGHLFCRVSQIKNEVRTIVGVIHEFYHTFGMDKDYYVSLSVRGDDKTKYLGSDDVWNTAEIALESAAKEMKLPYKRMPGEAAFYGPKLDFWFKDALGREWQLATIQCDFNLPEKFNLSFTNEKSEKERPVVIHRAISGSLERFMSVLIEHFAGKFPMWLNPLQVKIITVTDRNIDFAQEVQKKMNQFNIRVELDNRTETIGKKVHDAQAEKVNYIVTVGDKEVEKKTVAIRSRDGKVKFDVPLKTFIEELKEEIEKRE